MNPNNASYPYQINNPTDSQRHEMLEYVLRDEKRKDDLRNIIDSMSPPEDILSISKNRNCKDIKVAVIGSGEAGLASVFELRKIGCNITLFEASQRIGGRVYTYYFDRSNKQYGEFGPMSIPLSHETTWHYINLFNLETAPFVTDNENSLFYIRGGAAFNDQKGRSVSKNIYPKFNLSNKERKKSWIELKETIYLEYLNSLSIEARKELIDIKKEYSTEIKEIDKLSYRSACQNLNLSDEAISMLLYLEGNGHYLNLGFIEFLQKKYTCDSKYNYYIKDGMVNLPYSLYEAICDRNKHAYSDIDRTMLGKVNIKMGSPVVGIYNTESENKVILKYNDSLDKKEVLEEFNYVICAVPFSSLKRIELKPLFSNVKMRAINDMNYEEAQKIYLYCKERFWEKGNLSKRIIGGYSHTDMPLVSIYYPSDHSKQVLSKSGKWIMNSEKFDNESGALLASYSWGQNAVRFGSENIDLQINDVIAYISKIHNISESYIKSIVMDYKSIIWSDIQYIWGGGALSNPQDKVLFSYEVTLPEMDSKVFFAGEHISQKHISQQGALQSGMIVANEVAKQINENY